MIRIAICDDEKKILDEVAGYIRNYAEKKKGKALEVFPFDSASSLLCALEDGKSFDVFVLDVYIGEERGTALARSIRKLGIENPIIFATTSVEHAPESFETGTLRYLIKPISPLKFYEALEVALANAEKIGQRLIKLKTENGVESVNARNIIYAEAHAHYQYVTLSEDSQLRVRMTVSELYNLLAPNGGFIRVGSAYIINLRNVKNVSTNEVHMYHGFSVPIPRGKHSEIKKAFWDFQCEGQED